MKTFLTMAALSILAWITSDLFAPFASDLRRFDAVAIGEIEAGMWRAYYERRPVALYVSLAKMLRAQQGFPFWRAQLNAYRAARAAVTFKQGRTREQYELALPALEQYFAAMCRLGNLRADPRRLAALELEWWIVHRERGDRPPEVLTSAIADAAAELYGEKRRAMWPYAERRAAAMIHRDEIAYGSGMQDDDWRELAETLHEAYAALLVALHPGKPL